MRKKVHGSGPAEAAAWRNRLLRREFPLRLSPVTTREYSGRTALMEIDISNVSDTTAATTGVIYSTKNRCELSAQTAPTALSESDCDGFWLDGSDTIEGREFPFSVADRLPTLREIHRGVVGGPDRAIIYGLSYLLARGYKYLALVENDVLLTSGWLPTAISTMQRASADGLRVGAATVRTFDRRILFVRPGYAVMFNIGAGMLVLTREAAEALLATYRSTSAREINAVCRKMTQGDISQISEPGLREEYLYSADWFFDCALMQLGFASVGTLPALARNIDADHAVTLGIRPVSETQPAAGLDPNLFPIYHRNLWLAAQTADSVGYCFDPKIDRFFVFPHQLTSAGYLGEWQLKWRQCFGPFELQPTGAGDALRWDLMNGSCDVIFRADNENKRVHITANGSPNDFNQPSAGTFSVHIPAASGQSIPIEIRTDPGVAVSAILFAEPQPWFRGLSNWRDRLDRLGLIERLPAEADGSSVVDAPSIVGDSNCSLPHLIGGER
jgi:hypothetical protein